jgi:hypothetical protein
MAENETANADQPTEPGTVEKATDWFGDISSDLFNIEVNTILSDNITAQKMPAPRHALLDIGKGYYEALEAMFATCKARRDAEMGQESEQSETEAEAEEVDPEWLVIDVNGNYGSYAAFDAIRIQANGLMKDRDREGRLKPEQRSVLPRIKENSDLLKGMFNSLCGRSEAFTEPEDPGKESLPDQLKAAQKKADEAGEQLSPNIIYEMCTLISEKDTAALTNDYSRSELVNKEDQIPTLELRERDLVLIRKVWELSTEVIVMQTSIQVDGDVISRINSEYLKEHYFLQLRDYHDKGVDIALQHWSNLVDVAKELALALWKGITK